MVIDAVLGSEGDRLRPLPGESMRPLHGSYSGWSSFPVSASLTAQRVSQRSSSRRMASRRTLGSSVCGSLMPMVSAQ